MPQKRNTCFYRARCVEGLAHERGFRGRDGRAVWDGGVQDAAVCEEGVAPGDGVEVCEGGWEGLVVGLAWGWWVGGWHCCGWSDCLI